MSNTGTAAVLSPIAASLSLVAGMDPRGIILVITIASVMAIAFPSGSAECALAFAIGQHEPAKLLKYTVPYILIVANEKATRPFGRQVSVPNVISRFSCATPLLTLRAFNHTPQCGRFGFTPAGAYSYILE